MAPFLTAASFATLIALTANLDPANPPAQIPGFVTSPIVSDTPVALATFCPHVLPVRACEPLSTPYPPIIEPTVASGHRRAPATIGIALSVVLWASLSFLAHS